MPRTDLIENYREPLAQTVIQRYANRVCTPLAYTDTPLTPTYRL